jgi:transcriptional antiterminator NusG
MAEEKEESLLIEDVEPKDISEPAEAAKEEKAEEPTEIVVEEEPEEKVEKKPKKAKRGGKVTPKEPKEEVSDGRPKIYAVRTTANREDQVMDFLSANAEKKKLEVYAVIRPHGMRSYLFVEALNRVEAEQAAFDAPYARGVLPEPVPYEEIEHMVETIKREVNIQKNDIVEIISGPFKREQAKVSKVDKEKEEVVVELLEAAVPIPITLKMDALKVIRREEGR